MKDAVPKRVRFATDLLSVDPRDRVLEIVPGLGLSVAQIGERPAGGHLTAIDRSEVAVQRTLERASAFVEAG